MLNKATVTRECDRANEVRRVSYGTTDCDSFFQKIRGDLLMSGKYACDQELILNMIEASRKQSEMPVIVLTSHSELTKELEKLPGIKVLDENTKHYHPMWGLDAQAILRMIHMAGEEWGCSSIMDRVLLYAMAVLEIVNAKYILSLPAIVSLLKLGDLQIAALVEEYGLPKILADNIVGNQEAGILVRRIVEKLQRAFENIAEVDSQTEWNLLSAVSEPETALAVYQYSPNQKLFNTCLKEELCTVLMKVKKLRIILEEPLFADENDELLKFLMDRKRTGKIELYLCSENAGKLVKGDLNFTNVCMFLHDSEAALEQISEAVFGTYLFHYPVHAVGKPPTFLFTLKRDEHWNIGTEKRLCIRAADLYGKENFFDGTPEKMAIKIGQKTERYLVAVDDFLVKKNLTADRRIMIRG